MSIEAFTSRAFSPLLIEAELARVHGEEARGTLQDDEMSVKVLPIVNEVKAVVSLIVIYFTEMHLTAFSIIVYRGRAAYGDWHSYTLKFPAQSSGGPRYQKNRSSGSDLEGLAVECSAHHIRTGKNEMLLCVCTPYLLSL